MATAPEEVPLHHHHHHHQEGHKPTEEERRRRGQARPPEWDEDHPRHHHDDREEEGEGGGGEGKAPKPADDPTPSTAPYVRGGAAGTPSMGMVADMVDMSRYEQARDRLADQLRQVEATLVDRLHRLPSSSDHAHHHEGEAEGEQAREATGDAALNGEEHATRAHASSGADYDGPSTLSFEEQLRTINAKLISAEERIKRKTTLMKSGSLSSGLTDAEESPESPDATKVPKALHDALEEEKNKIEEELWDLKFKYEEEQRKVFALTSEKEALEQYVTQLAEEMQKETANMVSMKEQFEEQASPTVRKNISKARSLHAAPGDGATPRTEAVEDGSNCAEDKTASEGVVSGRGMDAETLAVELSLKEEELAHMRQSIEREKRKLEGEIVSLKFDLQKAKNELNVREGKTAAIKLELEKSRKRIESIEREKKAAEEELDNARTSLTDANRLLSEAESAQRIAQEERYELQQRLIAADAEVLRLRSAHEEVSRTLAIRADDVSTREAVKSVEDRLTSLQQEWERERSKQHGQHQDERWAMEEEYVLELRSKIARLEKEKDEDKILQREVKDELQRRIRKLEREKDEEKERVKQQQEQLAHLDTALKEALDETQKEREDRIRAETARTELAERLAKYEALGREDIERGQHLFLEREKELRGVIDEKESARRKIEADLIMLRVELQRAQARAAEATELSIALTKAREQLSQVNLYSQQKEVEHQAKIQTLEEKVRMLEALSDPRKREKEASEIQAKEQRFAQLSAELDAALKLNTSQLEMHEQTVQALKTQNALLSRELARLEEQQAEMSLEKQETVEHLQAELQSLRQAYKALHQQSGTQSDTSLQKDQEKDAALDALRTELDHIKQELFYTTAVGIKLNLTYSGQSCNINIGSLYEKVQAENVKWRNWNSWIHNQIEQRSPSPASSRGSRIYK